MAITLDSIQKLSASKKIALLVLVLLIIGVIYFFTLYTPQRDERDRLRGEYSRSLEELNQSQAIARDLMKFKQQVERLNLELMQALTELPNEKEIPKLLTDISSLGKESNLEFVLFRPKPEEPQQFYAKVPIELAVVGNYHNIGLFFDKISKLPRIISVADFNMTRFKEKDVKLKGGDTENLVKTSCLLNTYRFVDQKNEEPKSEGKKSEKKSTPKGKVDRAPKTQSR